MGFGRDVLCLRRGANPSPSPLWSCNNSWDLLDATVFPAEGNWQLISLVSSDPRRGYSNRDAGDWVGAWKTSLPSVLLRPLRPPQIILGALGMYFTDSLYDVLPDSKDVGPFGDLFGSGGESPPENYGATGAVATPAPGRPAIGSAWRARQLAPLPTCRSLSWPYRRGRRPVCPTL